MSGCAPRCIGSCQGKRPRNPQSQGYRAGVPAFPPPTFWPQVGTMTLKGLLQRRALQRRRKCWAPRVTRACGFPLCPPPAAQLPPPLQAQPPKGGRASAFPLGRRARWRRAERGSDEAGSKRPASGRENLPGSRQHCTGARSRVVRMLRRSPPPSERRSRPSRRRTNQSLGTKPAPWVNLKELTPGEGGARQKFESIRTRPPSLRGPRSRRRRTGPRRRVSEFPTRPLVSAYPAAC